ncbi:MAG: histidine kinase [Myxococcaceae bacterium]|nr:histidine kinase [Myxococcaceae bacterium]
MGTKAGEAVKTPAGEEDAATAAPGARSSEIPSGFITRDGQGRLVFDARAAQGSNSSFPSLSTDAPDASLWRAVSCGVVIHGDDGSIADANDAATQLFGRPLDELRGLHLGVAPLGCVDEHGTKIDRGNCLVGRAILTGQAQRSVTLGILGPAGDRRWLQADAAPVFDADGRIAHVVTTFVDITTRKESEELRTQTRVQLLEAERLAFIRTLATGLSHEINNPLAYLLTNLDFLSHELAAAPGSEVRAALDEARIGVHRVATIVKELKALVIANSKQDPTAPTPASGASTGTAPRLRLFVLDDEAVLTRALQRALGREHDIVTSNDSEQAGEALLAPGYIDGFDVVLCDIMMPGLTGIEVYELVIAKYPDHAKKFVFMSGGAFTPRAREFLARTESPRLEKPFEMAQLRKLLSRFSGDQR